MSFNRSETTTRRNSSRRPSKGSGQCSGPSSRRAGSGSLDKMIKPVVATQCGKTPQTRRRTTCQIGVLLRSHSNAVNETNPPYPPRAIDPLAPKRLRQRPQLLAGEVPLLLGQQAVTEEECACLRIVRQGSDRA